MRQMGQVAGVPVEPEQQTKLLDVCTSQAGAIGGGVPGGDFSNVQLERHSDSRDSQLADMMLYGSS